jgi:hypothetical protein
VDIVVAVRIARRATAFAIAKPGVETRRLEGMGGIGEEDLDGRLTEAAA